MKEGTLAINLAYKIKIKEGDDVHFYMLCLHVMNKYFPNENKIW